MLDVHLPPALAAGIRSADHECDEARKLIAPHSSDTAIADLANKLGAGPAARVVAGVNLPMLVRIFNYPKLGIDELAKIAVEGGQRGIMMCPRPNE